MDATATFARAIADFISAQVAEANVLATALQNAGNATVLIHEYRDTAETDDAEILKYRAFMDQVNLKVLEVQANIENYITEQGFVDVTPVDVDATTEAYKSLRTAIRSGVTHLTNIAPDAVKDLPELKAIPGVRSASATGVHRPRIAQAFCNGEEIFLTAKDKDGNEKTVSNFTTLAAHISKLSGVKVDGKDLHAPCFEAAGTTDLSSLAGKPVDYVFNAADTNYSIRIIPTVK
jgi:hypothetical protein